MTILTYRKLLTSSFRRYCAKKLVPKYDAVIVGGGMVGFCLAALTAASKLLCTKRILLLESTAKKTHQHKEEYENRVVALNDLSVNMLKNIGAWEFIKSFRYQPVNKMKVWETKSDLYLTFHRNPLAYIVENNLVIESLRNYLESVNNCSNVTILYEAQVKNIQLPPANHSEHLVRIDIQQKSHDKEETIETNLLIGADGFNSPVRKAANIHTIGWNHNQKAIVATLKLEQANEESTAWQRFLPTGPIALLPLSKEYSSLVWSTTSYEADRLMNLTDSDFVHELNEFLTKPSEPASQVGTAFRKLGHCFASIVDYFGNQTKTVDSENQYTFSSTSPIVSLQPNTKRACFPLGFQHATFYSAPRVNLGFGDVISLVNHLEEAISHGADIGSPAYLKDYTNDRQRIVVPLAGTLELINLLYSTDAYCNRNNNNGPFNCKKSTMAHLRNNIFTDIRGAGMSTIQSSKLLKDILMEVAVTGRIGTMQAKTTSYF
ncbi:Ubiquinone biosynthesis monooxygenase COQ6, mitochondrial [Schistosoma japonicum]|nr:Ubiquinone biosynthesis monooxygenase COQ6, mitochondrial [Schistosoma japonicum]KAH8869041.1 Ubiquinone biosynthesis monooxygenase COQ6, mitochondrial [Schistosoma japonicum]